VSIFVIVGSFVAIFLLFEVFGTIVDSGDKRSAQVFVVIVWLLFILWRFQI